MKILHFPKKFLYFFHDPCFYVTVQNFRLLDYVILLHATILGMTFQQCIIFIFLKSNTVLKVLFVLIQINKNLEYKFTPERERSIAW